MGVLKGFKAAEIASGQSKSASVDMKQATVTGLEMSEAWTTAGVYFEASHDQLDWDVVTDMPQVGIDVETYQVQAPAAGQAIPLDMSVFAPWRYLRVCSGTPETPVVQTALRQLYLTTWSE